MQQDPANTPPSLPASHEFNAAENREIAALAQALGVVGYALAVLGALVLLSGIADLDFGAFVRFAVVFVLASFFIAQGFFLQRASSSFSAIVTTEGADISHLRDALSALLRTLSLQRAAILVLVLAFTAAIAYALVR